MYQKPRTQLKPTSLSSLFTPKCLLNQKLLLLPSWKPNKTYKPVTILASFPPGPTSGPAQTLISLLRSIPDWADAVQERGMQKKRALYTHQNWRDHRSSLRHLRHVFSSLSSRVILSLVPPVLFFTAFAAAIAAYNEALLLHLLPDFLPLLRASSLPYQLTAPALALLLVFRTEASYSRFVEGKKAWTIVIAGTHDFARQVSAVVVDDGGCNFAIKHALLHYIIAFPIALKCHVLYGSDVRSDLQHLLEVDDLAVVMNSKHRPRCIIEFISQSIRLLKLEESRRNALVGVLIEEPFATLALDDLCQKAQKDIREAIATGNLIHARLVAKQNSHSEEHSPNGWPNS